MNKESKKPKKPRKPRKKLIEFIDDALPGNDTKVRKLECQVCGAALAENLVACIECKTPHHRDCFDYAKKCSTYGCEGRDYTLAKIVEGKVIINDETPLSPPSDQPLPVRRHEPEYAPNIPSPSFTYSAGGLRHGHTESPFSFIAEIFKELAMPLVILGGLALAGTGIYYWYRAEQQANQRLIDEVRSEDKGRLAYYYGKKLYVVDVQHIDNADDHDTIIYLPNKPKRLVWSEDGNTVFYLVDEGSIFDTIHRIDAVDIGSIISGKGNPENPKTWTVFSLSNARLSDDDINVKELYVLGDRLYFKLNDAAEWHSVKADGTGLQEEPGKPANARNQHYCSTGKHWLKHETSRNGSWLDLESDNEQVKITDSVDDSGAWWIAPKQAEPGK